MNPNDGNLSGTPSLSGHYSSTISALYPGSVRVDQPYSFPVNPGVPDIALTNYRVLDPTTLSVTFDVNATGGEDPKVYLLARCC